MYYIYHIPGVKIGCSTTPAERVAKQGYTQFDVLEVHSDIDEVTIREKELQREYGYEVDSSDYSQVYYLAKSNASKAGRAAGLKAKESGQYSRFAAAGGRATANRPDHPNKLEWTCEHCGKSGKAKVNYIRFHGDNCKLSPS